MKTVCAYPNSPCPIHTGKWHRALSDPGRVQSFSHLLPPIPKLGKIPELLRLVQPVLLKICKIGP